MDDDQRMVGVEAKNRLCALKVLPGLRLTHSLPWLPGFIYCTHVPEFADIAMPHNPCICPDIGSG